MIGRKPYTSPHDRATSVLKVLMLAKRPMTRAEIADACDLPRYYNGENGSVIAWVDAFYDAGILRIAGVRPSKRGVSARMYAFQPTPFALPDSDEVLL